MSSGLQKMKTGPDALGTVENESERVKHDNRSRRPRCPRYRRKRVQAQNMKIGADALGTVKNEPGRAKHKNGRRRPRYRRKRVQTRKT
jgi:hypothetical protein